MTSSSTAPRHHLMPPPCCDAAASPSKLYLRFCRAHGCSSCFSHPISSCCPSPSFTAAANTKQRQTQSTHVNNRTNKTGESTQSLAAHCLSAHHTLPEFTPRYQTCLSASCSVPAGIRQDSLKARGAFLRESVCTVTLRKAVHGVLQAFLRSLSTVSHSLVLYCLLGRLWFCTTHFSAVHQETSGSGVSRWAVA